MKNLVDFIKALHGSKSMPPEVADLIMLIDPHDKRNVFNMKAMFNKKTLESIEDESSDAAII